MICPRFGKVNRRPERTPAVVCRLVPLQVSLLLCRQACILEAVARGRDMLGKGMSSSEKAGTDDVPVQTLLVILPWTAGIQSSWTAN
jgi:hypothetical protein